MRSTVLVTGATGFLGSNLLGDLVRRGHHVLVMARRKDGMTADERVAGLVGREFSSSVTLIEGDLLDEEAGIASDFLRAHAGRVDTFIHAAAIVKFEDKYSEEHLQVNVEGTRRALTVAKKLGVPVFYHVSTAYTTGTQMQAREELRPTDADYFNGYERSKSMTEHLVMQSADESLQTAVFRPSIIVGDSKTGAADTELALYGFIKCMERFLAGQDGRSRTYRLRAHPRTRLNFVPVDMVCAALIAAMDQKVTAGIYHLTDPCGVPVQSMLDSVCRRLGVAPGSLLADADVQDRDLDGQEQQLDRLVASFYPYVNYGPVFHRDKGKNLFANLPYTCVDDQLLDFLVASYGSPRHTDGDGIPRPRRHPGSIAPLRKPFTLRATSTAEAT